VAVRVLLLKKQIIMNRHKKRVQMLDIVARWQSSGLSQAAFATEQGIKLSTLRYWISKTQQQVSSDFEPLSFSAVQSQGAVIQLRYPNGVELNIQSLAPVEYLRSLILL
jgi:DNA-binding transcriptional regulator YiaG